MPSNSQIMVVEDEVIVANHIERKLKSRGFGVPAVASTGEEAVEKALEFSPDLVLMDIRLGGNMDGVEAARMIRESQNIPVVFLTAYADDDTIQRAKITEPFGYIIKPYESHILHSTIEIALYKHELDKKLRDSEERYALAARGSRDVLWDWDLRTNKIFFSKKWQIVTGITKETQEEAPEDWFGLVHPEDRESLKEDLESHLEGGTEQFEFEYRLQNSTDQFRWIFARGIAIRDRAGKAYRIAGSQTDVTERRMAEEQLLYYTFNDPLTELPNRVIFSGILDQSHTKAIYNKDKKFALYLINLNQFKKINQKYGYWLGDQILNAVGLRLKTFIDEKDTAARLAGDVFAILSDRFQTEPDISNFAESLLKDLKRAYKVGEHSLQEEISFSMGVTTSGDELRTPEKILMDAEKAMEEAKAGSSTIRVILPL